VNADSAFLIGAAHAVCQDYAVAGSGLTAGRAADPGPSAAPYLILSDGCSSSPDTDVGARLLVKAAEQTFLAPCKPSAGELAEAHREAARRALTWAEMAGLRPQAVDATLLTAHLRGEELIVGCSGDGVLALQTRAGAVDVYSVSYASGYPRYPSYAHQPERLRALEDEGRGGKEVRRFRAASLAEPLRLEGATASDSPTEVFVVKALDYKCAALLSDGVHSFLAPGETETGRRFEAVPLGEALSQLIAFKTVKGAFVGRRLKRFARDCLARGWRHTDDLAVAALHLED
jgi:hypothetical protein